MNTFVLIAMIAAIAAPIYAEEPAALEAKKQDKRGVLGLGYGAGYGAGYGSGYYGGGLGYNGLAGYGGYGHLGAAPLASVNHAVVPAYTHAPAVSYTSHVGSAYHAPLVRGYSGLGYGGYGYNNLGYSGIGLGHGYGGYGLGHGLGLGHGYNNYLNGGHYY